MAGEGGGSGSVLCSPALRPAHPEAPPKRPAERALGRVAEFGGDLAQRQARGRELPPRQLESEAREELERGDVRELAEHAHEARPGGMRAGGQLIERPRPARVLQHRHDGAARLAMCKEPEQPVARTFPLEMGRGPQ